MPVSVLIAIYRMLIHLYPRPFREEFEEEMTAVFDASVSETSQQGSRALVRLCLKEVVNLPANLASAYWNEFSYMEVVMHREVDWKIWPSWIVLHLLSIPLAMLCMLVIVIILNGFAGLYQEWTIIQGLQMPALMLGFAAITGTFQWLLLRRYLNYGKSWGIATALGWLVGALFGYVAWLMAGGLAYSGNIVVLAGTILISFGFTIGVFQYLVLRQAITKASWWIVASMVGYSSLILLVVQPVTSILEYLFLITLPAIITGVVLWQLLQRGEVTAPYSVETSVQQTITSQIRKRKSVWILVGILALMLICLVAPLVWTVGQLTLAKADGIYATPEQAMTAIIENESGGYEIERIDILGAGPTYGDGRLPHVWFVGANIYADYRADGKSTAPKGYYSAGSYFVKVEDGWVHVSEGAFPVLMGRVMAWYGLEDCCPTK